MTTATKPRSRRVTADKEGFVQSVELTQQPLIPESDLAIPNAIQRLTPEQTAETFDLDAYFEDMLRGAKVGQGFEIELGNMGLETAQRRLDAAARIVLGKMLRFSYRADGKVLRFLVTPISASTYGRRSRRYYHLGRRLRDSN